MKKRVLWAAAGGVVMTGVLIVWRGFFPQHALIVGFGVTALIYSAFGAVERMRRG